MSKKDSKKPEINIPSSMCKKMLSQNGCRVQPDAVVAFKKMLVVWANGVSVSASDKAEHARRKTIFKEDLE